MGFSKTECSSASMIKGNSYNISCKAGTIQDLIEWGVLNHFED